MGTDRVAKRAETHPNRPVPSPMSGSGNDVHGNGKSSADHVSTATEVRVCGNDTCTGLQALRKQLKDLRGDVDHSLGY